MGKSSNLTFVLSDSGRLDDDARKSVRSHAMKDFRKKQRESRRDRLRKMTPQAKPAPLSNTSSSTSLSAIQFQIQLQNHFTQTCCPTNISGTFNSKTLSYGAWPYSASQSPRHAASLAISTLNLALDSGSRKALEGFHELYRQALRSLRYEVYDLKRKLTGETLGHVLAANYLFSLVEGMMCCSHDENGWQWHSRGLLDLVRVSGKEAASIADAQLESIQDLQTWRTMALSRALLQRQGLDETYFDEDDGAMNEGFTTLAFRVPGCLERLEKATAEMAEETVHEALQLRARLNDAGLNATNPFDTVFLPAFPTFNSWLGHELSDIFPQVYAFPNTRSAGLHQTRWMCLLELNKTLIELLNRYPELHGENHAEDLQAEMDGCAASLCKSLPFLSSPEMGSIGLLASTKPLYFARRHFESRQDERKLKWCWTVDRHVTLGYRLRKLS